jgi:hypothetical protein
MSTATVFFGVLGTFVAFVDDHKRCGDLDSGLDNGHVCLECSRGAQLSHPARSTGAESDIAARG